MSGRKWGQEYLENIIKVAEQEILNSNPEISRNSWIAFLNAQCIIIS